MDHASWTGTSIQVRSVYIAPIGSGASGAPSILTVGTVTQSLSKYGQIKVYNFASGALSFADDDAWQFPTSDTEGLSVFAGQFDGSHTDVTACGSYISSGNLKAGVEIYRWNSGAGTIDQRNYYVWRDVGVTTTQCRGVFGADLAGATGVEIAAGGYALISGTENGEVRTFNYDGGTNPATSFTNVQYTDWTLSGNTRVNAVFCGNVDGNAIVQFVTAGQATDAGGTLNGQLRVWHLS